MRAWFHNASSVTILLLKWLHMWSCFLLGHINFCVSMYPTMASNGDTVREIPIVLHDGTIPKLSEGTWDAVGFVMVWQRETIIFQAYKFSMSIRFRTVFNLIAFYVAIRLLERQLFKVEREEWTKNSFYDFDAAVKDSVSHFTLKSGRKCNNLGNCGFLPFSRCFMALST